MKDIMSKLANLEATAPKTTKKKMLNEDSTTPPMNVSNKPASLKDVFESIAGMKPIPVVGKEGGTQQTGAGFLNVTDNSPAAQALGKALGDLAGQKKVQIVVPTTGQQTGQPSPAGATGMPQVGQLAVKEKDEGKPGKNFAKIAKSASKRYGSKEAGERVAGAVRAKLAKQGKLEEEQLDEKLTKSMSAGDIISDFEKSKDPKFKGKSKEERKKQALGAYYSMHPEKSKKKANEDVDQEIADIRKTINDRKKRIYTPNHPEKKETEQLKRKLDKLVKSKEIKEADFASTQGIDTRGAGLGAGRSDEVLEGKKPDFLDLDKDGNKKEPMKKAAADKKKQKVKENMNHRISAARLEGKTHGLRGHAYHGKSYEDLEEMRAYHEGYKEGLDECYGQGVYETAPAMPAATVPGMANAAMPAMEDEMDEGNAFTAALARTPKGGKFSVGGKTFTDRSSHDAKIDEYAFESWDNQLNDLLNEGLSVSVSKGQQNSPDSVTITAQDAEADQLLQLVKSAGLGLFGDDHAEPSSAMSVQPSHGEPDEVGSGGVDLEVVDGSDDMLALMQKLGGVEASGHDEDYADEEGGEEEHTCNECGMMEAGCQCDKEQVEEVESEDQQEFEVAENAPDTGEAESTADENAEAKEDAALAGEEEEEMNESFFNLLGKLNKLAESKEEDEEDEEDVTESAAEAIAHANREVGDETRFGKGNKTHSWDDEDEDEDDENLNEWANQVGKGEGKGTDASFEQDIEFMTKVIAGGLNKPKSTGQTTAPIIAGQEERMHDNPKDWATLAGIKK